jgi:hypothetical protein
VARVQVVDQSGLRGLPSEQLTGEHARRWAVESDEAGVAVTALLLRPEGRSPPTRSTVVQLLTFCLVAR